MSPDVFEEGEIQSLLESIFDTYSYDFRGYSMSSVRRRLGTALSHFRLTSLSEMQGRLSADPAFFNGLVQFLTVPTSEMFRDPPYFKALREKVFPVLRTYPSLKIWVAGCSTGEEVYSIAILLMEEGLYNRTTIYATDINPISLKKAEQGIFPADRVKEYTINYQKSGGKRSFSDYFTAHYESAMLDKTLRRNIVFADHSLATDSVFSEVQLVSCRNVLIYFGRELQDRSFGLFYEALSHRGFLGIGSKETLRFSRYDLNFEVFCRDEKIYQRR